VLLQRTSAWLETLPGRLSQASNGVCGSAENAARSTAGRSPIVALGAAQDRVLPGVAALRRHRVRGVDVGGLRDRDHEGPPAEADHSLHVVLAGPPEAILERMVGLQPGELRAAHARAVARDLRHRRSGVVVRDRQRHAAEDVGRRPAQPTPCRNRPAHAPEDAPAARTPPPATADAAAPALNPSVMAPPVQGRSHPNRRLTQPYTGGQDRVPPLLRRRRIGPQNLVHETRRRVQRRTRPG